jgi:hypothetical protein
MGKRDFDDGFARVSLSHARTTPVVVETFKQRAAATAGDKLRCPSCGAKMKLVRHKSPPAALPRLAATCTSCGQTR